MMVLITNLAATVMVVLLLPIFSCWANLEQVIVTSQQIRNAENLLDFTFQSRFTIPFGPDLYNRSPPQSSDEQPYAGYGYAMGAGEEIAYDYVNHYLYAATEQGYVIVVDYADPKQPVLTNFSFDMTQHGSNLESLQICPDRGYFFLLLGELGRIDVFETVQRDDPKTPVWKASIELGSDNLPSILLPNKACTTIAVAKENPGKSTTAQGGITLVRKFDTSKPELTDVSLDMWDDAYVLRKGLHMPLTRNALEYWDKYSPIADQLNFTETLENYTTGIFLHPKKLAWSGVDDEELLVNLQENNGLIRINATTGTANAAVGYGVKDHSVVPVDINKNDKTCNMKTYKDLFAMRNPDTIATLRYNGIQYIVTANEGDTRKFQEFEDLQKAGTLFTHEGFSLPNVEVPSRIMDPNDVTSGSAALFNAACNGTECVGSVAIVVGSNAIDYESDPANPIFHRMVLTGGRGWSIYEVPEDPDNLLKLVFDSGDTVESTGCEYFPWAHNSVQDEEIAPADNFPNNTLWQIADEEFRQVLLAANDPEQDGCQDRGDGQPGACSMGGTVDARSAKDGATMEQVVLGEACGRVVALTSGEKNSIGFLFDITEVASPNLLKVFHLSPASQHKSPGVAYNNGELGEIDPENSVFLSAERSPTGKPAVLFAGAMSGTVSFWEFDCAEFDNTEDLTSQGVSSAGPRTIGSLLVSICSTVAVLLSMTWLE